MALLRIGRHGLNTDNVAAWRVYELGEIENYHPTDAQGSRGYNPEANRRRVVRIETTAVVGGEIESSNAYQVELFGDDADAFLSWLDRHATDLRPATEMDEEWQAYKDKGGTLTRATFEAKVAALRDVNRELEALDISGPRWHDKMDRASRLEEELLY